MVECRHIVVLLSILFSFSSCLQRGKNSANQINRVIVYGMARGIEFSHAMHSMEDVIRNGRDTIITDKPFLRSLSREINHLQRDDRSHCIDFRTAIVIIFSDNSYKCLLLGENNGIQYEGNPMREQQSLFSFIDKNIYKQHNNSYWFDDFSRDIMRTTENAQAKAELLFEQIKQAKRVDSLLLNLLPSDYINFQCLCSEFDVLCYRAETNNHLTSEVILSQLFTSNLIDYSLFVEKMTDLSASAYLPSSKAGVDLQKTMKGLLSTHLKSIISRLDNKSEEENKQFWDFLFYGLYTQKAKEESIEIRNRILQEGINYQYIGTIPASPKD